MQDEPGGLTLHAEWQRPKELSPHSFCTESNGQVESVGVRRKRGRTWKEYVDVRGPLRLLPVEMWRPGLPVLLTESISIAYN